jgi:beta-lactamase regulating signal transducer with metallopeptidase domain
MHGFWEIVASNAVLVAGLAVGVALLGRVWKNAAGLHVLWLLVLVKLFTPPVVTIGLPLPAPWAARAPQDHGPDGGEAYPPTANAAQVPPMADGFRAEPAAVPNSAPRADVQKLAARPKAADASNVTAVPTTAPTTASTAEPQTLTWSTVLAWTWGIGIGVFASSHAFWMHRFARLLRDGQAPPDSVSTMAARVSRRMGLKRVPQVLMLPVRLSPLVWSAGGRPRVILPAELFRRLAPEAQEAILVHELAHVRRKDHLVRLLELFATTVFWWHPAAWWASRQLRGLEEQCCDAAVLRTVPHAPRTYANALVDTLGFISEPPVAVPMGATAAKSPLSLARRIEMLTNHAHVVRLTPGRMLLVATVAALPMAVAFAAEAPQTSERPPAEAREPGEQLADDDGIERHESRADNAVQAEGTDGEEKSEQLRVGHVEEVAAEEPGARAVRFSVDVPKGLRFRVTLREVSSRIVARGNFVFENERDQPALVEIRFEYLFEYQGDKSRDVLLSEEKLLQFEAEGEGCYPPGVTTIAGVPLGNLARPEKKLILVGAEDERSKAESGVRVLLIVPKNATPKTSEDVEKLDPRGELIVSLEPMPNKDSKPDPAEQLRRAWRRGARAVGTAYIKYRRYRVGPSFVKRISHESVDALLSSFGPSTRAEQVLPIVRELLEAEAREPWSSGWGTHLFRSVGLKTLDTHVREGKLSSARFYDGEIDVRYAAVNRQVDVHRAGGSVYARTPLSSFRISPPEGLLSQLETSVLEDGRVRLSHDRLEIVADPATGFIHRDVRRDRDRDRQAESLQYGPTSYPGGIYYPRLKLHFGYRDGKLDSVDVIVIDEARFNGGFSDADFALPLPAGTLVVDYREDTFRPTRRRLTHDVDDAAEQFRGRPERVPFGSGAVPDVDQAAARFEEPAPLRFEFRHQPWEDVLTWLAEEAGLALVMDAPPPGVLNYQDERAYSVAEAIELLNTVLRPQGYELVRHRRTLRLVKLEKDGLIAPVQVEVLPHTDALVIRGKDRDVKKVVDLIDEIEDTRETDMPAKKNEAAQSVPKQPADTRSFDIILAEHVILMDGELATPSEVEGRLREQAAAGPVHPRFLFTAGAFEAGKWKTWHDRAYDLHRELRFSPGFTVGSVSHLASRRYDAIRTADDLRPDPSRRIEGTARLPDGRPAAGATVVVRQRSGRESEAISLRDGRLRSPVNEVWTQADERGRFAIYPAKDEFSVAVLHEDGFAAAGAAQLRRGEPIVLEAWATIDLTLRRSPDHALGASLRVRAIPAPDAVPLGFDAQLSTGEASHVSSKVLVPSGSITASTFIAMGEGVSVAASRDTFDVGPGETKQIELGPPTKEDVQRAEQNFRELHGDESTKRR